MIDRPQSLEDALKLAKGLDLAYRERRSAERQQEQDAYRLGVQKRRLALCRKLSEIGERFEERTFNTFEIADGNAEALIAARDVVADPSLGAYIWGSITGNGKSHLAGAIVNDCIAQGIEAVFITGVTLRLRIQDTYTPRGKVREGKLDIIDRLVGVRVLVLDDLGTEKFTEDTAEAFYALINGRYEHKRALVVTSNLDLADLALKWMRSFEELMGAKLADRLREMCTFKVQVTEQSHRGAVA